MTKRVLKKAVCVIAACIAVLVLSGCAQLSSVTEDKQTLQHDDAHLLVAVDAVSPPMLFMDTKRDTPTGFEAELLTGIAARLGKSVEYLDPTDFVQMLNSVEDSQADIGASACTVQDVADAKSASLVASDSYLEGGRSVIARMEDTARSLQEFNTSEVTVVVQEGSANEQWIEDVLPQAQRVYVDTPQEGLIMLASQQATLAVYDTVVANYYLNTSFSSLDVLYTEEDVYQYCFVLNGADQSLVDEINAALQDMKDTGIIASLQAKWFPNRPTSYEDTYDN